MNNYDDVNNSSQWKRLSLTFTCPKLTGTGVDVGDGWVGRISSPHSMNIASVPLILHYQPAFVLCTASVIPIDEEPPM